MSKNIDLEAGPLSEAERDHLLQRGRYTDVQYNDALFDQSDEVQEEGQDDPRVRTLQDYSVDPDTLKLVMGLNVSDLKAELDSRNLSKSGDKDELRHRLLAAYEKEESEEEDEDEDDDEDGDE